MANREATRAHTCEGHEMPRGNRVGEKGSLFGQLKQNLKSTQTKAKLKTSHQKYMENQGKATNDFGGNKRGKFGAHTHTHLAEGEIVRGKCRAHVKGHTVRLESLTR